MKIAIIGTGRVGNTLAEGFVAAGHDVVFGSRDPDDRPGLPVPVVTTTASVEGADVVVAAVPGRDTPAILREIGAAALAGKVLIDVGNALGDSFDLLYPNAGLGAALQAAFPQTRVVKTLNTVSAPLMAHPGAIPQTAVFLSGDDPDAKKVVAGLLEDLGWPAKARIDLGDISTARATEHYFFLSMDIGRALGTTTYGIAVVS
jgi:predicted dinucleotide-binding enzyme